MLLTPRTSKTALLLSLYHDGAGRSTSTGAFTGPISISIGGSRVGQAQRSPTRRALVTTLCVVTHVRTLRVHWRRNVLQQGRFHLKGRGASDAVRSHAERGNEDFAVLLGVGRSADQNQSVREDANCRRRLPTPIRRRKAAKRHKSATGVVSYNEN